MKKSILTTNFIKLCSLILITIFPIFTSQAVEPPRQLPNPDGLPSQAPHVFELPSHASEIAKGVFDLGYAFDSDGTVVQGFAFVRSLDNHAKPSDGETRGNKGGGKNSNLDTGTSCYSFIGNGAKWKIVENYMIDTSNQNTSSLTELFISSAVSASEAEWEVAGNIFADKVNYTGDGADTDAPDSKNELTFAQINDLNTIAVTTVWGTFSGPPQIREIVEWDMVFNNAYLFGDSTNENPPQDQMDFSNILTHEIGHAAGMGHTTTEAVCEEQTMYPTAPFNEIKKRTIEIGDETGIKSLY